MSDLPEELDLKFLPDWLKSGPTTNPYADFQGEPERDRRDDRRGGRPPGGGGSRGNDRGARPGGARPPGGGPRRDGGKRDFKGGGDRREPRDFGNDREPRPKPEPRRIVVRAEILPEPAAAVGISKQIKTSVRACGVFRVAKMFLDRPERFRIRITALDESAMLFQIGDGPVCFDRPVVEAGAFRMSMDRFYDIEKTQSEPPKGNYTSVARHRFSGVLLGPSNHHSYQVASRKLYEERFSRRMSFPDFQRDIEMVSDPAVIEQWKAEASAVTVYKTKSVEGEEQQTFKDLYDVEQHFRTTHLPTVVKFGNTLEISGHAVGFCPDRNIGLTIRDLIEHERQVPVGLVNSLRPYFSEAGLHLFKWRRKTLLASAIRPQRHPADQTLSDNMTGILNTVEEHQGLKRPELAKHLLGDLAPDAPDAAEKRERLAADLHYLIHLGYVVEMQNGSLELPPSKKEIEQSQDANDRPAPASRNAKPQKSPPTKKRASDPGYHVPLVQLSALTAAL